MPTNPNPYTVHYLPNGDGCVEIYKDLTERDKRMAFGDERVRFVRICGPISSDTIFYIPDSTIALDIAFEGTSPDIFDYLSPHIRKLGINSKTPLEVIKNIPKNIKTVAISSRAYLEQVHAMPAEQVRALLAEQVHALPAHIETVIFDNDTCNNIVQSLPDTVKRFGLPRNGKIIFLSTIGQSTNSDAEGRKRGAEEALGVRNQNKRARTSGAGASTNQNGLFSSKNPLDDLALVAAKVCDFSTPT